MTISLREITDDNIDSIRALRVRPEQARFVSSVAISPWFLWKLLIDHRHQRLGHGHEVMRQIVELIRGQGAARLAL